MPACHVVSQRRDIGKESEMISTNRTSRNAASEAADGPSDMLERLNEIPVKEEMFAECAAAVAAMPDALRCDFDQRMLALIETLKSNHPLARISLTALAVDFRLRALVRLLETTLVHGCEVDLDTRMPRISSAALRAACTEPLIRNAAGLAAFEADSFRKRLLH
jgi:hypothetical protein